MTKFSPEKGHRLRGAPWGSAISIVTEQVQQSGVEELPPEAAASPALRGGVHVPKVMSLGPSRALVHILALQALLPPPTSQIPATWGPHGAQVGHDLLRSHTAPSVASAVPAPPSRVAQAFSTRKSPWLRQPDLRALRIQMSSSRSEHVEGRKPWASPNINQ